MVSDQIQIHAAWVAASLPVSGVILLVHALTASHMGESAPGFGVVELKAARQPEGTD
jgi:hypothetical protein